MASSASPGLTDQMVDQLSLHLRVHAVNVFVRDQDRSLDFYLHQLGFGLAFDIRLQSGQRWVAVAPPDGTAVLNLIAPEPETDQFKLIGRPTGVVFVTEDVAAKYSEWRKRGVRFRHTPRLRRVKKTNEGKKRRNGQPPPLGKKTPHLGGGVSYFENHEP